MAKRPRRPDEYDITLGGSKPLAGRTENQKAYLRALQSSASMVFGLGPAGSGKTFLSTGYAAEQLFLERYERIILTRATVPVSGEQIGFLPGTLEKKMEPWTAELFDVMNERLGREKVRALVSAGKIQVIPFAFMRGRTFKNSLVLCDEMQNSTPAQAKMLVTRIGEGSRYFLNGDLAQSDIRGLNGLDVLTTLVDRFSLPFPVTTFTSKDVSRSDACRLWVEAYEKHEACSDTVSFPPSLLSA